jgi:hypothetical protein
MLGTIKTIAQSHPAPGVPGRASAALRANLAKISATR